jgi:hypothetical protein
MMIAFLVAVSAVATTPSCEHLVANKIDRLADSVLMNGIGAAAHLSDYWRAVCIEERAAAPRSIVLKLAELLAIRDVRFLVSSDLMDVGPNLVAAKPYVDAAVADERLRYDQLTKKEPVVFKARIHYDAVMCVERKIETGTLDARYCRGILAAGSD